MSCCDPPPIIKYYAGSKGPTGDTGPPGPPAKVWQIETAIDAVGPPTSGPFDVNQGDLVKITRNLERLTVQGSQVNLPTLAPSAVIPLSFSNYSYETQSLQPVIIPNNGYLTIGMGFIGLDPIATGSFNGVRAYRVPRAGIISNLYAGLSFKLNNAQVALWQAELTILRAPSPAPNADPIFATTALNIVLGASPPAYFNQFNNNSNNVAVSAGDFIALQYRLINPVALPSVTVDYFTIAASVQFH